MRARPRTGVKPCLPTASPTFQLFSQHCGTYITPPHTIKMPTLLGLPAEIRNRIYEYALDPSPNVLQVAWPKRRKENENKSSERINARTYVLYIRLDAKRRAHHFNQLRYVCQQMHKETSDLEVKHTGLIFHPSNNTDISTIYGLKKFVSELGDNRMSWLGQIFLSEDKSAKDGSRTKDPRIWISKSIDRIFEVLRFCARHQHIRVQQTVPYLTPRDLPPSQFIYACLLIIWTFRREDCTKVVGFRRVDVQKDLRSGRRTIMGKKALKREEDMTALIENLKNLKFMPMDHFDETLFRKLAMTQKFPQENGSIDVQTEDLESWVFHAKAWMKGGM